MLNVWGYAGEKGQVVWKSVSGAILYYRVFWRLYTQTCEKVFLRIAGLIERWSLWGGKKAKQKLGCRGWYAAGVHCSIEWCSNWTNGINECCLELQECYIIHVGDKTIRCETGSLRSHNGAQAVDSGDIHSFHSFLQALFSFIRPTNLLSSKTSLRWQPGLISHTAVLLSHQSFSLSLSTPLSSTAFHRPQSSAVLIQNYNTLIYLPLSNQEFIIMTFISRFAVAFMDPGFSIFFLPSPSVF